MFGTVVSFCFSASVTNRLVLYVSKEDAKKCSDAIVMQKPDIN